MTAALWRPKLQKFGVTRYMPVIDFLSKLFKVVSLPILKAGLITRIYTLLLSAGFSSFHHSTHGHPCAPARGCGPRWLV